MGLLKVGQPLAWNDTVPHSRYIRDHGIKQFLHCYRQYKDIEGDRLFYGDEVEFHLVRADKAKREVQISLIGPEIMQELNRREKTSDSGNFHGGCTWHQEYGSWMLEGTPAGPYGGYTRSLLQVEQNMRLRRARLRAVLPPDHIIPTIVAFPMMGVGDFVHPHAAPGGPSSESDCVPDACINPHPRFGTLTANIRERRGSKVDIRLPLFKDDKTEGEEVQMDCMAFGMGCCCLQVTFQACDVDESRYLFDQLATLTPIMLALTAASPVFKGRLVDTDVRWKVITDSVDDRTPAERGLASDTRPDPRLAGGGTTRLSKSRYDSISAYISDGAHLGAEVAEFFNDLPCEIDAEVEATLLREDVPKPLARHLAHLFARDPLVAFEGSIEVDDESTMEHFESLNSTNWQTMRWKPPPPEKEGGPHIGWRTEFRSMEVQLTDFENAAFTAFVVLLTRVLLVFDLEFLMPLSKVDENMKRAHKVNAANTEKFYFRKHVVPGEFCPVGNRPSRTESDVCEEMTMVELMTGKGAFPGFIPLIHIYLEHIECDPTSLVRINDYLTFLEKRARGDLVTPATWIRRFVTSHRDYKQDSVVSQSIAYDLLVACDQIGMGKKHDHSLLGEMMVKPIDPHRAYDTALRSGSSGEARSKLLEAIRKRADLEIDGPGSKPSAPLRKRMRSGDYGMGRPPAK